jgi:hypothetical protein
MFSKQLKVEIEFSSLYDILICDRSIVDYIAYTSYINEHIATSMISMVKDYINKYVIIYFKKIKNNQYLCNDGIRSVDLNYQRDIENKLMMIYNSVT